MVNFFKNFFKTKIILFILLLGIVKNEESQINLDQIDSNLGNYNDQLKTNVSNYRKLEDEEGEEGEEAALEPDETEVKFVDMFLSPSMIRNFILLFAGHKLSQGPQDLYQDNKLRMIDLEQEKVQLALVNSNLDHELEDLNSQLLKAMDGFDFYQSKILGEIVQYKGVVTALFNSQKKEAESHEERKKKKRRKRKLNTLRINDIRNNIDQNNEQLSSRKLDIQKKELQDKIQKLDKELKLRSQIVELEEKIRNQIDKKDKLIKNIN